MISIAHVRVATASRNAARIFSRHWRGRHVPFLFLVLFMTGCGGGYSYNAPEAWYPLTEQGVTREQALNDCLFEAEKAKASAGSDMVDRVMAFVGVRDRCMTAKGFYTQ